MIRPPRVVCHSEKGAVLLVPHDAQVDAHIDLFGLLTGLVLDRHTTLADGHLGLRVIDRKAFGSDADFLFVVIGVSGDGEGGMRADMPRQGRVLLADRGFRKHLAKDEAEEKGPPRAS